ncbi:hypothetical protein [Actinocatenispora rupis]|uniref:Uncharacterized protein n=1 Tax=Actinocatenispora rupis TaxID=519421 RepID=A0A8J3NCN6_9ACTN|nr:hypothetical protein [Actinocatenispora rupis]GID14211.1 hypothetical protein Aru02nite_51000 [Actinocatenispora rupis]
MRKTHSPRTRWRGRAAAGAAAVVTVLVGLGTVSGGAAAQPAPIGAAAQPASASTRAAHALPGGKTNFVVSVGSFFAGRTTNWERIGYYTFHPSDGTVTGTWWRWNQNSRRDIRVDTPVAASGCGATRCYTRTMKRFLSRPTETAHGKYVVNGSALTVAWPSGSKYVQEKWTVARVRKTNGSTDGSLVELVWAGVGRGYTATGGYGFGSNASLSANASAATLMQSANRVNYRYVYSGISAGKRTGGGSSLGLSVFHRCKDGRCLGATTKTAPGNGCRYYPPGDTKSSATINYYLAHFGGDRRDAYEHWFRCLGYRPKTGQSCYKLNSHVKPMLQVIDDKGRFRGWVGAETSYKTTADGNSAGPAIYDTFAIFKMGPRRVSS